MNHSKSWCVLVCSPTPLTLHSLNLATRCFQLFRSESLKRCLRPYLCQKYNGEAICYRKLCIRSFSSSCSRALFNKLNTKWSIFAADLSLLSWTELGLVKHWASWKKVPHRYTIQLVCGACIVGAEVTGAAGAWYFLCSMAYYCPGAAPSCIILIRRSNKNQSEPIRVFGPNFGPTYRSRWSKSAQTS
jgi:hypothetical protein